MNAFRLCLGLALIALLGLIIVSCSKDGDETGDDLSIQEPADRIHKTVEQMPKQINVVSVHYPLRAVEAQEEGIVHVKMLLTEDGAVEKVSIFRGSGFPSLDSTAIVAAEKCLFSPGRIGGQPVRMWLYKSFAFQVDQVKLVDSNGQQHYLIDF